MPNRSIDGEENLVCRRFKFSVRITFPSGLEIIADTNMKLLTLPQIVESDRTMGGTVTRRIELTVDADDGTDLLLVGIDSFFQIRNEIRLLVDAVLCHDWFVLQVK